MEKSSSELSTLEGKYNKITKNHPITIERIEFGNNGRKLIIENFEENIVINKYIEIIKKICN